MVADNTPSMDNMNGVEVATCPTTEMPLKKYDVSSVTWARHSHCVKRHKQSLARDGRLVQYKSSC